MKTQGSRQAERGQIPLDLGHTPSHAEADFVVGAGNTLALAHVLAFPNWSGPLTLITGPAKSGKSHLARIFAERSSAGTPGPDEIAALASTGDGLPLVLEDVDREAYQEADLFHLLNQSMRDHRPILMTARAGVSEWPYRTDDLLSRARLAAQFSVAPADDMVLSHLFAKLYSDRQVGVDPKVVGYLIARMERSPEEVVALVDLTDRLALARGSAITRAIALEALQQRGAQLELDLEGDEDE